jgi:integrase
VAKAEWSEIDLESRVWTIPAAKMKMRRDHKVPLSQQALDVLGCCQSHQR